MGVDLASYNSPQMQLIYEIYRGITGKDANIAANTLHKDFHLVFHPQSLGKQTVNKDEWLATVNAKLFNTPVEFEQPTYHSIVESLGKVVVHSSLVIKGFGGKDVTDESLWIIEFAPDEDGTLRMKQIDQFVTAHHLDVFPAVNASE